jgi:hypothetical protein
MGRWSDWYHLTDEAVNAVAPDFAGVYEIALDGRYGYNYPKGWSNISYIGSSPLRSVKERLREHITGRGNECVYYLYGKYPLLFSWMVPESPYDTERNVIDAFVQRFGDLPKCNNR